MRKVLVVLLVYSILMTLLVFTPFAANANETDIATTGEAITSGTIGDCTWIIEDHVLTISGVGELNIPNDSVNPPWRNFTQAQIMYGVTGIGRYVFHECTQLTNISIPNSVTSISYSAFSGCSSLTDIVIPKSVEIIGEKAFYGCTHLTNVSIPDSVKTIGRDAFLACPEIKSITLSSTVTDIYEHALGYYFSEFGMSKVKDFTIYGYTGSAAERYAVVNNFTFVALDEPTEPEAKPIKGDIDGDGEITIVDTTYMQRYLAEIEIPNFGIGEPIE